MSRRLTLVFVLAVTLTALVPSAQADGPLPGFEYLGEGVQLLEGEAYVVKGNPRHVPEVTIISGPWSPEGANWGFTYVVVNSAITWYSGVWTTTTSFIRPPDAVFPGEYRVGQAEELARIEVVAIDHHNAVNRPITVSIRDPETGAELAVLLADLPRVEPSVATVDVPQGISGDLWVHGADSSALWIKSHAREDVPPPQGEPPSCVDLVPSRSLNAVRLGDLVGFTTIGIGAKNYRLLYQHNGGDWEELVAGTAIFAYSVLEEGTHAFQAEIMGADGQWYGGSQCQEVIEVHNHSIYLPLVLGNYPPPVPPCGERTLTVRYGGLATEVPFAPWPGPAYGLGLLQAGVPVQISTSDGTAVDLYLGWADGYHRYGMKSALTVVAPNPAGGHPVLARQYWLVASYGEAPCNITLLLQWDPPDGTASAGRSREGNRLALPLVLPGSNPEDYQPVSMDAQSSQRLGQ